MSRESTLRSKANWRAYQIAHGKCCRCAQPWKGPPTLCPICRKKHGAANARRRERIREARRAAGLPVRPRGWNGLQHRPHDIARTTPEELMARSHRGGQTSGRRSNESARTARVEAAVKRLDACIVDQARAVLTEVDTAAYQLGYHAALVNQRRERARQT